MKVLILEDENIVTIAGGETFHRQSPYNDTVKEDRRLYSVNVSFGQGGKIVLVRDLYEKESLAVLSHILSWLISDSGKVLRVSDLKDGVS